jgi:IS5 family transposase
LEVGRLRRFDIGPANDWDRLAQVWAWVEHPFHIVKNLFRHKKLRYRGLAKNTAQLHILFALANLAIVKKTLLAPAQA